MSNESTKIELNGVATNNLKGFNARFPIGKISVVTGVSGSGKSSLVFDSLYGESYRRYVESLSSFARQYMKAVPKPDIEGVLNLPPAIAVKQVKSQSNARSTVGTATELYDLVRILFSHLGKTQCRKCGKVVKQFTVEQICDELLSQFKNESVIILASLDSYKGGKVSDLKKQLETFGFVRAYSKKEIIRLDKMTAKDIYAADVVVDRVKANEDNRNRLLESVKTAHQLSRGKVKSLTKENLVTDFPTTLSCCGISYRKPSAALFSFNHPIGACQTCQGFGAEGVIDWEKVFPDHNLSLSDQGVAPWNFGSHDDMYNWAKRSARKAKVSVKTPFSGYSKKNWEWLKFGNDEDDFSGVKGYFDWLNSKKHKAHLRIHAARFRKYVTCSGCKGFRLNEDALSVKLAGLHLGEMVDLNLEQILEFLEKNISDLGTEQSIFGVEEALLEIKQRIRYLIEVGLGYLTLNRQTRTLSGGEFQRINMARCLGSALTDTLYCLDEPTSGLHARDGDRLMTVIENLRDQGNTVVVVEHERNIINKADHLIEIGPQAGHLGGELTFEGLPKKLKTSKIDRRPKKSAKKEFKNFVELKKVQTHNLKSVDLKVPLNALSVVCGVSGSGKTSLIQHSLYPRLGQALEQKKIDGYIGDTKAGELKPKSLSKYIHQVIHVSQVTLGRSSRSTIATYLGVMNELRKILADQASAKSARLTTKHFSFNTSGGRCETCRGLGTVSEDLSFLGEMNVECPECNGKRFSEKVLSVKFREKNLNDILSLTIAEARELFFDHKKLVKILDSIMDLGLGYMTLGQGTSSFSGGEGQRLKLLRLLQDALNSKPSFLIFDEPTTGLSDLDVSNLITQLRGLVEKGHTVLVVEHHLDVIQCADWIVEVGPEAADKGGEVIYQGDVSGLKKVKRSVTAKYLNWN